MRIAVIGANGFVGKNLVKILKTKHKIIKISRKTKFASFNKDFDLLIHSANSSKRHKSGLALRFPRVHRIRWDKPVDEVLNLKSIKEELLN